MRIVVIGGTGHIGTWLVPRLVRSGHDVVVVSRGTRHPYQTSDEWENSDHVVIDRESTEQDGTFGSRVRALRPDAVIDLICFDRASAAHLVDALRDDVGHFIHCGTLWVHGVPVSRPYDETAPRQPFGDYGIRKAEIEEFLLSEARTGFPATILHPGHITGPGWNPINPAGHLDMRVFEQLRNGSTVVLPEDGSATLQHVHADDVAAAFALAIAQPAGSIGEAFHVASREPVTMASYARTVAGWFGREAVLEFLPWEEWRMGVTNRDAELTEDHMRHSPCASIAKAERVLGFSPRYTAVEAVREALLG
ncbi:MAG TPA: NAD-dependent epimerase/dehydratase family protein [Gemmatimonadaceae bacterium]|jgi:nucleoside-diphosphate-sugar epimerase|nr:NAD-dependent epimerase/dehydratase family protein [Gemmatimonadaceae bacterium]